MLSCIFTLRSVTACTAGSSSSSGGSALSGVAVVAGVVLGVGVYSSSPVVFSPAGSSSAGPGGAGVGSAGAAVSLVAVSVCSGPDNGGSSAKAALAAPAARQKAISPANRRLFMAVPPPFDPGGLWDKPSADFKAEYTPANGEKTSHAGSHKKRQPALFSAVRAVLNLLNLFRYTVVTSVWQVPVTA